VIKRDEFGE